MTRTYDRSRITADETLQYDDYVKTMSARVYPVIADQILERTRITKGACLDVGSGPASLAIALASLSDLRVTALDRSPDMVALAFQNIKRRSMEQYVIAAHGDVHAIPAGNASFDLVVSRGSFHSWDNLPLAFREIYRVLRPGGMAYIGGGYGNARIRDEVLACRKNRADGEHPGREDPFSLPKLASSQVRESAEAAGIRDCQIIDDDSGLWIIFQKEAGEPGPRDETMVNRIHLKNLPVFRNGFFVPR